MGKKIQLAQAKISAALDQIETLFLATAITVDRPKQLNQLPDDIT